MPSTKRSSGEIRGDQVESVCGPSFRKKMNPSHNCFSRISFPVLRNEWTYALICNCGTVRMWSLVYKLVGVKCRDGEIGRRSGLKIRRSERTVGVRFPLPAPSIPFRGVDRRLLLPGFQFCHRIADIGLALKDGYTLFDVTSTTGPTLQAHQSLLAQAIHPWGTKQPRH